MPSIMENIFRAPGETTGYAPDNDQIMAFSSINAAAASANAYLIAALKATTPEVRRLFGEYLTQSLMAHETLTGLALKKGWLNPYEPVEEQLNTSFQASQAVLGQQPVS